MDKIQKLIDSCKKSEGYFFKYVSANDTGTTGAHQAGFYMPRESWSLFFDSQGKKGENREKWININWPDGTITRSRFIWYGKGTRAEYRLTNGFSFLKDDDVGDILVLSKINDEDFSGFLLTSDDEIELFFDSFGLSPNDAYKLQKSNQEKKTPTLDVLVHSWLTILAVEFPSSNIVSAKAREFLIELYGKKDIKDPDKLLLEWIDTEFTIFKYIENDRYRNYITKPFDSVERLIEVANSILNRRKSRAGHSLENHLAYIFDLYKIPYTAQATTEQNKKPDFIFPGESEYKDKEYPTEKLNFLAVKTTCKDRWRQVINEADRIDVKHLFTLQQGISLNQLKEMEEHKVKLVVPEDYKKYYPKEFRDKLISLEDFINYLNSIYGC